MKHIVIALAVLLSGCDADMTKKSVVVRKVSLQLNKVLVRNIDQYDGSGTWVILTNEEFASIKVGDEYKGGSK